LFGRFSRRMLPKGDKLGSHAVKFGSSLLI
jgi:hypothetical protein